MGFSLGAALVVVVHLAYVVFTLAGGFLAWRWPKVLRLHIPTVGVAAMLAITGWECPLTDIEKGLRRLAGETPYTGGFISHYLVEPVHPRGTTPTLRVFLRVAVVSLTTVAYLGYLSRRRSRTGLAGPTAGDTGPGPAPAHGGTEVPTVVQTFGPGRRNVDRGRGA